MDTKTIESQYSKMLAFNYGNKDALIKQLNKGIGLYKTAKNLEHPKVKYRLDLYNKIIDYARNSKKRARILATSIR